MNETFWSNILHKLGTPKVMRMDRPTTKSAFAKAPQVNNIQHERFNVLVGPTYFLVEKCLSSTPVKNEKISIKCAQNGRCTSSICEQPLS